MDEKKLRLLIEAVLDEKGFKQSEEALKKLGAQTANAGEVTKQASKNLSSFMDKSLSFLGTVGSVVGVVAGGMAPIAKSAQDYVNSVKLANATSREWLATTSQIEQAQIKVNKANAEFFGPIYSKYGDLMKKVGDWAENNPEGVVAGTGIAGAVGTIGALNILKAIGTKLGILGGGAAADGAINTFGGVGTATYGPAAAPAAGTAAAAGVGVTVLGATASVLAGLGLGFKITDMLSQTDWGKENNVPSFNKTAVAGASVVGDFLDKLDEWIGTDPVTTGRGQIMGSTVGGVLGEFDTVKGDTFFDRLVNAMKAGLGIATSGTVTTSGGANDPNDKSNFKSLELTKAQMDFRKQELYAQQDYIRSYGYAVSDFNRNRIYQEMDYQRQIGISSRNFNIQQAQSERMFYLQRAIALRDFQISVSRNDYDYAVSRKRAQEDQNFSLKQIMISGDALAYYYSQRQFNINKTRAEEDYQLQKQRSQEDFNRSQGDSLMFFGIERAFTKQQFDISMADRALEYQIMRDRAAWEFENITLKRMNEEYGIAANRRMAAFNESILPEFIQEEKLKLIYQTMYRDVSIQGYIDAAGAMQTYFGKLVTAYSNAGYAPGAAAGSVGMGNGDGGGSGGGGGGNVEEPMAVGGYTYNRRYQLHDHEYVLTKNTTKSLESVAQGRLTQEKVMGLLTGGGSGMTYNDNRQFSRGLSVDEKIIMRQELRQMVVEAFR